MDIPAVEKISHMSSYPLLEYMGFDTDISDGYIKTRTAPILGEIFRLYQRTKNMMKCVHKNSNYGLLVAIPDSDTQELFQ